MQHHIFLSYSRKDAEWMTRLRDDFRAAGLSVWTDEGIEPGTLSWKRTIEAAILGAGCLVCVLSPDASSSNWVRAELDFAELQGKPIFLILARGDERSAIPFGYASFQWVDVRADTGYAPGLMRLVMTIQRQLENNESPPSSVQLTAKSILPAPFDWCAIPAGKVTLSDTRSYTTPGTKGGTYEVADFQIAKYPITNAQFQVFVDAPDGYQERECWTFSKKALDWHHSNPLPQPTTFPGADLPRTNVTWYEAFAFCRWLSARTGDAIALPTDQQWQRAAQGDDGRRYPWGSTFDSALCSGSKKSTMPVTRFPDGASPYGVVDMSGNVWEWCLNNWQTGSTDIDRDAIRVLRGGSYYDEPMMFDVTYRSGGYPQDRNFFRGFRLANFVG